MAKNASITSEDLDEIRSRLEWFDEERRKNGKRLSSMERQVAKQKREFESRESVIHDLENRLASATSQIARLSQIDEQLQIFKDELVKLIEQYDRRRITGLDEIDKLRRVEQETYQREFSDIRNELGSIKPLQEEMELRVADEARLSGLIGLLQNKAVKIEGNLEDKEREFKFLEEASNDNTLSIGKLETEFVERTKRIEALEHRLDGASYGLTRAQTTLQELSDEVVELRHTVGKWSENIQTGEHERNQQIKSWKRTMEEYHDLMDRYAGEWIKFSEQYNLAKMAVETMEAWQTLMEQRQNEASELTRVEANRMKTLWDNFVVENDKHWKNFEVDQDQRWTGAQRREKQLLEQLHGFSQLLEKIEQDKDTLWRVQTAQADAMKMWPRILLEEVEKAIAHNPDTRRQPALVPVREE